MTYHEAVAWLYSTQLFGIKLGLENMRRLAAALDLCLGESPATGSSDPSAAARQPLVPAFGHELPEIVGLQQRDPPVESDGKPIFLHVAGTNGKGSVCAMLDSILREAGVRTGLYTSPHLVTFRERIRLDGEMISEEDVAEGLTRIRKLIEPWEQQPTFFEIVTALALSWFQDQNAQAVVLETGLGGRLDATNIVTPAVSVITEIALDHEKYLGSTLAEIATEKAGIIKPNVPVVSARQAPEARVPITRAATRGESAGSDDLSDEIIRHFGRLARLDHLLYVEIPWTRGSVGLAGSHQRWNAALALLSLLAAGARHPLCAAAALSAKAGLAKVQWPGRFQRVGERIVLDGAHNPAAAQRLAQTWREEFGDARATLILGVMRDKDVRGVCAALVPIATRILAVHADNPRSCSAQELATIIRETAPEKECTEFPALVPALAAAEKHPERILIAGSLFLVGEALVALNLTDAKPEKSVQ